MLMSALIQHSFLLYLLSSLASRTSIHLAFLPPKCLVLLSLLFDNIGKPQGSTLGLLLSSSHIHSLGILIQSQGLNAVYVIMSPKWISPAQTSLLKSKFVYPITYWTFLLEELIHNTNSTCVKLNFWSHPQKPNSPTDFPISTIDVSICHKPKQKPWSYPYPYTEVILIPYMTNYPLCFIPSLSVKKFISLYL